MSGRATPSGNQTQYDPRVWGAKYRGRGPIPLAIFFILLLTVGSYLAYTKDLPFVGEGTDVRATFANATTLRTTSPVRIAGVNVGKVTAVEAEGDNAEVTMTLKDEALPIHEDAIATIRPRLFLEGNFFIDLQPGTPAAGELGDDDEIPITQTSTSVQIDEVLAALQGDTREGLKGLLSGYGTALSYQPSAIDDADQEPISKGKTGAQALADSLRYGGPAGRDTAIVNDALRGESYGDLAGLINAQRNLLGTLETVEGDLQGAITAFNVTAGALAAEQENVQATIRELGPTFEAARPSLANLDKALPPLRKYVLALEPGVAELPDLFDAATPWLAAANDLLEPDALQGLAEELERGAPVTAEATQATVPLLDELSKLSRCVTDNLDPTFDTVITVDPNVPAANAQPAYLDFLDSAVNTAGAAANFDGNGHYLRVQTGGGDELTQMANPNPTGPGNNILFGNTIEPTEDMNGVAPFTAGTQPPLPAGQTPPPFEPDQPCQDSAPADLNGPVAAVGPGLPEVSPP